MPRILSSRWTFASKWIFPVVWSTGFGLGTLVMFVRPDLVVSENGVSHPTLRVAFAFLAIWILSTVALMFFARKLKRVSLDGSDLLISNYRREIRVPLASVQRITEDAAGTGGTMSVTIDFIAPTEWGSRVCFVARWRRGAGRAGQLSEELRLLVADAQARQAG